MATDSKDSSRSSSNREDYSETNQDEKSNLFLDASGNTVDKVDWYRNILKIDPTSHVSFLAAEELCARGLWEEATEVCRGGLTFHPYHFRGQVLLGLALSEVGKSEEAESILLKVKEDLQKNLDTFRDIAEAAESRGDITFADKLRIPFQVYQPDQTKVILDPESFYRAFDQAVLPNLDPEFEEQDSAEDIKHSVEETMTDLSGQEPTGGKYSEVHVIPVLGALLERYEQHVGSTEPKMQSLFSDSERRVLKSILSYALHG